MNKAVVAEGIVKTFGQGKRALDEIKSEQEKIINNIRSEFSGLAISAAEKIVEREVTEKNHDQVIASFLEKAKNIKN